MTKEIPLPRGHTALVDDNDYNWLNQWRWLLAGPGYAGRFDRSGAKPQLIYMHRVIMDAQPGQRVDHINGARLDNRRDNLRLVSSRQNQQNRRPRKNTSSGHKGVTYHKRLHKWHVRITVDGQCIHLGYYKDLMTAALLYDAAARQFFGEYARPNYPDKPTPPEIAGLLAQVIALRAAARPMLKKLAACHGTRVLCREKDCKA